MRVKIFKLLVIAILHFMAYNNAIAQNPIKHLSDSLVVDYAFKSDTGFFAREQVSGSLGEARFGAYFSEGGLYFDGTDDELVQPRSEITRLAGNEISIAAWIKADGTDSINAIISKFYAYELKVINGFLELKLTLDGFKSFTAKTKDACVNMNQLHHIVAVRSGDSISFFVDGYKKKIIYIDTPSENNLYPANNDIYIGSANNKEWFDGVIYDLSIYKTALNAIDVHNIITGNDIPNQGPIIDAGSNLFFTQKVAFVPLEGKAYDYHGEIIKTSWVQSSGKPLQILNDTIQNVDEGEYAFKFTAYDNNNDSVSKEIKIICFGDSEATCFVSPSGSDTLGNGTKDAPFRTIEKAVESHQGIYHKTIVLLPGEHLLRSRITLSEGISVLGSGVDYTKLKPDKKLLSQVRDIDSSLLLVKNVKTFGRYGHFSIDGCNKQLNVAIAKNVNNIIIENLSIHDTYFSGIGLVGISNSQVHDIKLVNTSWGDAGYSAGAMVIGDAENVDIYNIDISEGLINKPTTWGYGIKAYSLEGSSYLRKLRIFDATIETNNKGFWNNGEAPNMAIEFHSTSFDSCEIFNVVANNTISLVPNVITPGSKNMRLHHNKIHSPGGVPIESYMKNCEIDHNYIIGEYTTIKGFNNNTYEDYLVHHNVFTDQYPKTGHSQALSYGALKNLKFYNNTCYFTRLNNVTAIELFSGISENIEIVNNIFYSETYSQDAKVIGIKNGAEVRNTVLKNNVLYNYNTGIEPDIDENNFVKDPNLNWKKSLSYWVPVASDTSWLVDRGVDVGLMYSGVNPDIGAGEAPVGLVKAPVIIIQYPYHRQLMQLNDSVIIQASAIDKFGISNFEVLVNDTTIFNTENETIFFKYKLTKPGQNNICFRATNNEGLIALKSVFLNAAVKLDSLHFIQKEPIKLKVGQDTILNYLIYPDNATNGEVYWHSDNEEITLVDNIGHLNAINVGVTKITILSVDGKHQSEIIVEVEDISGINNSEKELAKLTIWPNPSSGGQIFLKSESIILNQEYDIKVFQMDGVKIFDKSSKCHSDGLLTVDLSDLLLTNRSLILIALYTNEGQYKTQKLLLKE